MKIGIGLRALRAVLAALVVCVSMTGCMSMKMYVDPALPVVSKAQIAPPATPRPVHVLFEFRTKGSANAKATAEVRSRVVAVAAESGLFSSIADAGQGDAGVLKLVIDNIPKTDNAAAKGFGTGLTLGMVGSMITDGYVCTATYTRDGKSTETVVRHALHSTIGNHSGPANLKPMEPQAAIHQVMDQMTWNSLKELADKNAFTD